MSERIRGSYDYALYKSTYTLLYYTYLTLLAPTDDLIRFCKSNVKVTAGCCAGEGSHVNARASKLVFYLQLHILLGNAC